MNYEIFAPAVCYLEEDESGLPFESMIITHNGSQWLVATWFLSHDTGKRYPARIVPMKKLSHSLPPEGFVLIETILPTALFDDVCPPELVRRLGVVEFYPSLVHIQTRDRNCH